MTSKIIKFPALILLISTSLLLANCGNSSSATPGASSDTVNRPAPDNNSANNPSLADSAYPKKDSGIKRTDTPVVPPVQ